MGSIYVNKFIYITHIYTYIYIPPTPNGRAVRGTRSGMDSKERGSRAHNPRIP